MDDSKILFCFLNKNIDIDQGFLMQIASGFVVLFFRKNMHHTFPDQMIGICFFLLIRHRLCPLCLVAILLNRLSKIMPLPVEEINRYAYLIENIVIIFAKELLILLFRMQGRAKGVRKMTCGWHRP